jgi:hypothetical protein
MAIAITHGHIAEEPLRYPLVSSVWVDCRFPRKAATLLLMYLNAWADDISRACK